MLNHFHKHKEAGVASIAGKPPGASANERSQSLFSNKHRQAAGEAGTDKRAWGGWGRLSGTLLMILATNLAVAQNLPPNVPLIRSNEAGIEKAGQNESSRPLLPAITGEAPETKKAAVDSSGSVQPKTAAADPAALARPKISIPDSAAYILGYEYIAIHSGQSYDIQVLGDDGALQPLRRVEGLRILGGLELEKRDACIFAYQAILYGDYAYMQINPKTGLMLAIPRQEIVAIRVRGTDYEIRISDSAGATDLSIQKIGSDGQGGVYATVRCARDGPAFGAADYSDGENLRALAAEGELKMQPVSEQNHDGFPVYKPEWKDIKVALPREK